MGLAASQCRLLVLTARKSDLEYRAQNITNRKLLLSAQTENIAMEYTRKLNNRQMRFVFDFDGSGMKDINESLTINSIYTNNNAFIGQYRVRLADGRIAVSSLDQLPFTVKQGGAIQTKTPQEMYAELSETEKLSYFMEALTNVTTKENVGELESTTKEYFDGYVMKESGSSAVDTRRNDLTSLLNAIYGVSGASNKELIKIDSSDDTKKVINTLGGSNFIDNVKEATNGGKFLESIVNLMKSLDDASKDPAKTIKALFDKYYNDADLMGSAATAGADTYKLADTTVSNRQYAAAIYALNEYLLNNSDTKTANTFLDAKVDTSDYKKIATDLKDSDLITRSEYLKGLVSDASSAVKEDSQSAITKLQAYMNEMGANALNLIYNYSSFSSRCMSTIQGGSQQITQIANDQYYNASTGETYIVLPALENAQFFQNALRNGSLILEEFKKDNDNSAGAWSSVNIGACDIIQDKLYTEDDAAAEAEYETQTAIIQTQDKMLDVELRQVETQQKACDNEYESVKKILDKNIERSFKVFS